jgi:hypothetical protein
MILPHSITVILWLVLVGCASGPSTTQRQQASGRHAASDKYFSDTLAAFQAITTDEIYVKDAFKLMKTAYKSCDRSILTPVVAPAFKELILTSSREAVSYGRQDFLAKNEVSPENCEGSERELLIAQLTVHNPTDSGMIANFLATYQSRFFKPRFIGTAHFVRDANTWMMDKVILDPIHPIPTEDHRVTLYIADLHTFNLAVEHGNISLLEDTDILFSTVLKQKQYDMLPADGEDRIILFAFQESPLNSTSIGISHTYYKTFGGGIFTAFAEKVDTDRVSPWFYHPSKSTIVAKGTVDYALTMDGVEMLRRRVQTYRM